MNESDSEIYLAPADILAIPCESSSSSSSSYNSRNDNHAINTACSKSSKQLSNRFSPASNLINSTISNVLLEAVYHKGAWFAVDQKQLEECQAMERRGKLAEVRIVKVELMDLPEELKLCLVENYRTASNDCSELSDDEQFFTRGSKGGYRHLSVRDTFEGGIHDPARGQEGIRPPDESQEPCDDDDDDGGDDDDSSSEGDWSGEDCNSSDDHGCRRICDDGRSASSDSDEECLLKD